MNCIHHPDVPVAAYCQNCGKALCQDCVRSIGGVVYCEACLAARLNTPAGAVPGVPKPPFVGLPPLDGPNPGLALGLGFIPGVGAMYNGQFVKGVVHMLIFALLCTFSNHSDFFGWMIPFWIAYQVFDAYQTAKARRDGTTLPNPFGLNDLGYKLGLQPHPETPQRPYAAPFVAGPGFAGEQGSPGASTAYSAPPPPYTPVGAAPYPPADAGYVPYTPPVSGFVDPANPSGAPGMPYIPATRGTFGNTGVPVGAIILIGLGTLFLLSSMGIFRDEWLGRSWPLILVGIGIYMIVQRTRNTPGNPPNGTPGGKL
jgi:TM2 domain-containing membrane protein YozV